MTLIQINTEEVSRTGTDFNRLRGEVESVVTNAKNMMSSLEGQFKGQRAGKIFSQWHEMEPSLQSAVQALEAAGALLIRAADDFGTVDAA